MYAGSDAYSVCTVILCTLLKLCIRTRHCGMYSKFMCVQVLLYSLLKYSSTSSLVVLFRIYCFDRKRFEEWRKLQAVVRSG